MNTWASIGLALWSFSMGALVAWFVMNRRDLRCRAALAERMKDRIDLLEERSDVRFAELRKKLRIGAQA